MHSGDEIPESHEVMHTRRDVLHYAPRDGVPDGPSVVLSGRKRSLSMRCVRACVRNPVLLCIVVLCAGFAQRGVDKRGVRYGRARRDPGEGGRVIYTRYTYINIECAERSQIRTAPSQRSVVLLLYAVSG